MKTPNVLKMIGLVTLSIASTTAPAQASCGDNARKDILEFQDIRVVSDLDEEKVQVRNEKQRLKGEFTFQLKLAVSSETGRPLGYQAMGGCGFVAREKGRVAAQWRSREAAECNAVRNQLIRMNKTDSVIRADVAGKSVIGFSVN